MERQLGLEPAIDLLNVVIHVIGLGLINESVVHVLSGAIPHRRFMPTFATGMSAVVLLATALHGIEAATWATAYRLLGALPNAKSAILYSFSVLTSYGHENLFLEEQWQLPLPIFSQRGAAPRDQ